MQCEHSACFVWILMRFRIKNYMSHMNGGTCTLYKTSLLNYAPKISDRYNLHVVANRWKSKKKKITLLYLTLFIFLVQLTKCLEENQRLGQGSWLISTCGRMFCTDFYLVVPIIVNIHVFRPELISGTLS